MNARQRRKQRKALWAAFVARKHSYWEWGPALKALLARLKELA